MEFGNMKIIEDGIEKEYKIIAFCKNDELNKCYVIYQAPDDDNYYASRYEVEKEDLVLYEISSDDEWDFIDKELSKIE